MDLSDLTLEKAKAFEGTEFVVTLADGRTLTMTLDEVVPFERHERRRSRGATPKRAPFSLYFLGPPSEVLPQGMYRFESATVSFANLFIVPIGRDEESTEYEAVFT